ncbi:recombinase family protein [Pelotomaculum propionicicum]|uniref:DNA-invertase hin n=1 Tax=Pelotomaculum propionicicum TaxID=258475 RepID=A0A4Y7RN09_9FIRM|nr:recombinase family protein [Pelotomaculum propionicicum]NLI11415.1 recombinase family protein [Peptococcaceae bacterium]TEB09677.1 DNA-invertase hin [Pelotomaculum propionicicum]
MLAACYIRVSTDEQAEQGISIPAQKSRLLSYCQARGWEVYGFYVDDGYSGKDLDRPAMQRLIEDAAAKKFNTALVLKLDRLSRRQKDVLYLLEEIFEPGGVGFKSVTESFDTTTPFGKAALGMMAVFAQLERETIVERVRMAKNESARQGRFMGGPAPFGYRYNFGAKKLEIDEIQAQEIRWIYDRYLSGKLGYGYIAGELERKGVPGPTDERWNKTSVRKILTNPAYAGLVNHKGSVYQGKHEAIISPEKWREVQVLIKSKGAVRAAAGVHTGLLSGIIWCGECGARMRVKNVWQNYPRLSPKKVTKYYVCYSQDKTGSSHMVRDPDCRCGYKHADEIENEVIQQLYIYSYDKVLLRQAVNESLAAAGDKRSFIRGINQARKDFNSVEKKLEKWCDAFEKGALEPDELVERVKELKERKAYLHNHIIEMENRLKEENERKINTEELLEILQNFTRIWENATADERREIVINTIKEVRIYTDNRIEVEFNL